VLATKTPQISLMRGAVLSQSTFHLVFPFVLHKRGINCVGHWFQFSSCI